MFYNSYRLYSFAPTLTDCVGRFYDVEQVKAVLGVKSSAVEGDAMVFCKQHQYNIQWYFWVGILLTISSLGISFIRWDNDPLGIRDDS